MHLLVLSAFRLTYGTRVRARYRYGLNAPSGAQCFPTSISAIVVFPPILVSMHLLVLSAFRHVTVARNTSYVFVSQCTFWCSVLSDKAVGCAIADAKGVSQCTFWCSVLSDRESASRS